MTNDVLNYVKEKISELTSAYSCCAEAKAAANAYLAAIGTENEAAEAKNFIAELEEDITSIDALIALTGSETGEKIFGAEKAAMMNAHAKEIKARGAIYCDCPACTAAAAILAKKDEILG